MLYKHLWSIREKIQEPPIVFIMSWKIFLKAYNFHKNNTFHTNEGSGGTAIKGSKKKLSVCTALDQCNSMICSQSALSSSVGAEGRQGLDYWKSWVKFQHIYILSSWLLNPYVTRPDLGPPPPPSTSSVLGMKQPGQDAHHSSPFSCWRLPNPPH